MHACMQCTEYIAILVFGALGQCSLLSDAFNVPVGRVASDAFLVHFKLETTMLGHEGYGVVCNVHVKYGHRRVKGV